MLGLATGAVIGIFVAAACALAIGFWGVRRYLRTDSRSARASTLQPTPGLQADSIAVVVADGSLKQNVVTEQDDTLNVALRRLSMGTEFDNGGASRRNPLYQTVSRAGGAAMAAEVRLAMMAVSCALTW